MNNYIPVNSWLVIKTKPRAEKKLYEQLTKSGYEAYLPTYEALRQWSDRKKKVQQPLISGVVFVKNNVSDIYSLYDYPLIIGVLKEFNKPALVSQQEINNLIILIKEWNGELIECKESLSLFQGDKVEVWAPLQDPQTARAEIAHFFEIPIENITVNVTFLGGGFGRKSKSDFVVEAVALSKKIDAPVQVVAVSKNLG